MALVKQTFTAGEVLQSIKEGMNLWDFAIKFGISNPERSNFLKFLLLCTNDNKKAKKLYEQLISNSDVYVKKNVNSSETLNYDSLLYLARIGYSRIEIMKKFGRTSYASFCTSLRKIFKTELVEDKKRVELTELLKANTKSISVKIIPEEPLDDEAAGIDKLTIEDPHEEVVIHDTHKKTEKIVIYTIEYLKRQNISLDDELFCGDDEKIILSTTLSSFINSKSVSEDNKIKLSEAVLSQALILCQRTKKRICIATCEPKTALNAFSLGFEVRIPKSILYKKFADITNESLSKISYYKCKKSNCTCFIF